MSRFLKFLAGAALVGGAVSFAQDRAELFAQLDRNQDGFVALDEVPAEQQAKFKRLLKLAGKESENKLNKALFQGALQADRQASDSAPPVSNPAESRRASAGEVGDLFARLDANGDGLAKPGEVPPAEQAQFERLLKNSDIDGDGQLSQEEFAASTRATGTPRQPGRGGPGAGRPGGPPGDPRELFARMDRNQDGKLSKEEAPPRLQENFGRVDADDNGNLSLEEFVRTAGVFGQRPPGLPGGQPPPGAPPVGLFALLDIDRDGEISTTEIVGAGTALLKLDRNGDGKLTPDEVFAGGPGRPPRPGND